MKSDYSPGFARWGVVLGGLILLGITLSGEWMGWRAWKLRKEGVEKGVKSRLPSLNQESGYLSSDICQTCHPQAHASWHRTFHRTMTQAAGPGTVLGRFDGSEVESQGLSYRVFREGDGFFAEMPDPEEMMYVVQGGKPTPLEEIPRVKRRVVMTTGSHHYQTYWVEGDAKYGRLLQTLPLVYLIGKDRWIPREDAFMHPPKSLHLITQWNHHCINCHSTGGNPGLDLETGQLNTSVGELGISCEACHGPAREHVELFQGLGKRYEARLFPDKPRDSRIVNPAKLDHQRSSQVCGQCHGVFIRDESKGMEYAQKGLLYRPGEDLHASRYYIRYPREGDGEERWSEYRANPEFFRERWWEDGTILAGGREYTAMMDSGCYLRGEMSCLSCHSMHEGNPVDQIRPEMRSLKEGDSNRMCNQCHREEQYGDKISQHTFHAPNSEGSRCVNCHMPHTTYALLGGIRSHQIQSPQIRGSAKFGVPNACNLCHLDRTLAWTQEHLVERYGQEKEVLTEEQGEYAASLIWLLKGDAAQRVISAWHMGWEPALEASGSFWQAPYLAWLLADPYGVVRYVAGEQMSKLPGMEAFEFDYLSKPEERMAEVRRVLEKWKEDSMFHNPEVISMKEEQRRSLLYRDDGEVNEALVRSWLRQRNNRAVRIKE